MSNFEIANRIMTEFLTRNPGRKPEHILKIGLDGAFYWGNTEEGYWFWSNLHFDTFNCSREMFHDFMKKYYFADKHFVNLRIFL